MRVFKRRWRTNGKLHVASRWTIAFRDHHGAERMVKGRTDHGAALDMGRNFDKLVSYRAASMRPDPEMQRWIETLTPDLVEQLRSWDVLSGDMAGAAKGLSDHLDDFRRSLEAKGGTAKHARTRYTHVKTVLDGCRFKWWSAIEAAAVMECLDDLRKVRGFGAKTFNDHLSACKQFAAWMVRERRAMESPLAHLKPRNERTDRRHIRRALSADECRRVLSVTKASAKTIYGMTGPERAMLYRVAMETGLRWRELRSLTRGSFALDGPRPTVAVEAAYSKHRRDDTLPLRLDTAAAVDAFMGPSLPTARAFPMPASGQGSKILRADLEATGIAYEDAAGRVVDFHALRHTFITNLCNGGLHPKAAQVLARHSTIMLTMDHYTHLSVSDQRAGLDVLPDLTAPVQAEEARATGTAETVGTRTATDRVTDRKLTVERSERGRLRPLVAARKGSKTGGQKTQKSPQTQGTTSVSGPSDTGAPERTRTPDIRIRNPMLYPTELLAQLSGVSRQG